MHIQVNQLLAEILTITDYPQDKDEFIEEFEGLNILEAVMNVYDTLPEHQQDIIKSYSNDVEAIKHYIPKDAYIEELTEVTELALNKFLKDISPTLTSAQKEKIQAILPAF